MGFWDALRRQARGLGGEAKELGKNVAENAAEVNRRERQTRQGGVNFDQLLEEQQRQDPFANAPNEPDFRAPPPYEAPDVPDRRRRRDPPDRQFDPGVRGGGGDFASIAEEFEKRDEERDRPGWMF